MSKKAFSLVELSIVLIIIGLLVAGISSGRILINQAKLNRVISQADEYTHLVNAYQLTYDALPGDHSNALDFFPTCQFSGTDAADECNGDGNTKILQDQTEGVDESHMVFHHLKFAELTSFSPSTTFASAAIIGVNAPESPISQAHYKVIFGELTVL